MQHKVPAKQHESSAETHEQALFVPNVSATAYGELFLQELLLADELSKLVHVF